MSSSARIGWLSLSCLWIGLAACCSAERTSAPEPDERNEVVTEPREPAPVPVADDGAVDCATRPSTMCCQAMTPECIACQERASEELARWEARCGGDELDEPLPTSYDCAAPPPMKPCCRALLPKCTRCGERNRAIDAAYRAQCGSGDALAPGDDAP